MKENKIILKEGGEKRGGTNPGKPGKRPAPPPAINKSLTNSVQN